MKKKKCICLGSFDGLHKGHQTVLENGKSGGYETTLVTFDIHPAEFFSDKKRFKLLQNEITDEKLAEKNMVIVVSHDKYLLKNAKDIFVIQNGKIVNHCMYEELA